MEDSKMFNKLMSYGMSRADALDLVQRWQQTRNMKGRLKLQKEAIVLLTAPFGVGRWDMVPSTIFIEDYVLSRN